MACGSGALVLFSDETLELVLIPTLCHRWDCPKCAYLRRASVRAQARAGLPERLVTLTLRPRPAIPLIEQIRFIRKSFRTLIQRIRRNYPRLEYMSFLELQHNGTPHLHVLTRGSYISQRWLSRAWVSLTGAFKVDIRKIDRVPGAVAEVTKYLTKTAGSLQVKAPGQPIVTKSRRWLPPDFNKDSDPPDPFDFRLYIPIDTRGIASILEQLGGCLESVHDHPSRRIVVLPRPPTYDTLASTICNGSWGQAAFALILLHAFSPAYAYGISLEEDLDALWCSFTPGVGRDAPPPDRLVRPAPQFPGERPVIPLQAALFAGGARDPEVP